MTVYRSLKFEGTSKSHELHEADIVERVDGGFEVTWHSSPSITTFYPFHRIREYQVIDTDKPR
jgi:hypothetical protein